MNTVTRIWEKKKPSAAKMRIWTIIALMTFLIMGLGRFGFHSIQGVVQGVWSAAETDQQNLNSFWNEKKPVEEPRYGAGYYFLHLPFFFISGDAKVQRISVGVFYLFCMAVSLGLLVNSIGKTFFYSGQPLPAGLFMTVLGILILLNYSPFYYALHARYAEIPELLFLSLFLFWFLRGSSFWAGAALAIASAIKVLPLACLFYLLFKRPWAGIYTIFTLVLLFILGGVYFGDSLGFPYLRNIFFWSSSLILCPENLQFSNLAYHLLPAQLSLDTQKLHRFFCALIFFTLGVVFLAFRKRGDEDQVNLLLQFGCFMSAVLLFAGGIAFNTLVLLIPSLIILYFELFGSFMRYGWKPTMIYLLGVSLISGGPMPIGLWDRLLEKIFQVHFYPGNGNHFFFFLKIPTYGMLLIFLLYGWVLARRWRLRDRLGLPASCPSPARSEKLGL